MQRMPQRFPVSCARVGPLSRKAAAVRTTSRTCNCYAPTATGLRVTGRRSTWVARLRELGIAA